MPFKKEEDTPIKPRELVFLLAIAGRLDAQSKLLAQKLDNDRWIYHFYAVGDSLSSTYSMFKYFFEVFLANSKEPDLMQRILTSPEGVAAVTTEALFLVTFSFLASYFDGKKDNNSVKRFIVAAWPYFRDGMKGLKNAYKGWKSVVQVTTALSGVDLKYTLIPVGLALGILATANRIWLRYVGEKRKAMMVANTELLLKIQKFLSLTKQELEDYLKKIQYQDADERIHAYFAVGFGGFIDGLYLYVGVMGLALLVPPAYIAMTVVSALYIISCVISRLYEEYDYQLRLLVTQTKCKLAIVAKELEATYGKLCLLQDKANKNEEELSKIEHLKKEVSRLITSFEELRRELKEQTMSSYLTVGLLGLKHGLFAYGVVASILFMVVSVCSIAAATFPPALLIACIISGLAIMLGITAYTTRAHYLDLKMEKKEEDEPFYKLVVMKDNIQKEMDKAYLSTAEFKEAVKDGITPKTPTVYSFQEWFEVFRSFFSGFSKGNNFANFAATPFHTGDHQDHQHDSPVMTMVSMTSAALFAIVLALRALSKGFGRPPLGQSKSKSIEQNSLISQQTNTVGESSDSGKRVPASLTRNRSVWDLIRYGIFPPPRPQSPNLERNPSPPPTSDYNIVVGLN